VNDAPGPREVDIGIAMGTGTEVVMQSAAVTLVKGDLAGIASARILSRMTMRNIRQNLVFAFAYNVIGMLVAAAGALPYVSPSCSALWSRRWRCPSARCRSSARRCACARPCWDPLLPRHF
jgi:cation transport ATPase